MTDESQLLNGLYQRRRYWLDKFELCRFKDEQWEQAWKRIAECEEKISKVEQTLASRQFHSVSSENRIINSSLAQK